MENGPDILSKINRQSGMTVPDNYFSDFMARMKAELPQKTPVTTPAPRSFWQQARPYVYLAAMFAGIWCMMQMFNIMGRQSSGIDSNPVLAEALDNETFVNDYLSADNLSDYDLYDDLYNQGISVSDLTASL